MDHLPLLWLLLIRNRLFALLFVIWALLFGCCTLMSAVAQFNKAFIESPLFIWARNVTCVLLFDCELLLLVLLLITFACVVCICFFRLPSFTYDLPLDQEIRVVVLVKNKQFCKSPLNLPQTGHGLELTWRFSGLSEPFVCVRICCCRLESWINDRPQFTSVHLYGRSPVWSRVCCWTCDNCLNERSSWGDGHRKIRFLICLFFVLFFKF